MTDILLPLDFSIDLYVDVDQRLIQGRDPKLLLDALFAEGAINTSLIDNVITVSFDYEPALTVMENKERASDKIRAALKRVWP